MSGAWSTAPRHFIFERNATTVHDLTSFGNLMRYNNYKHDPLSHNNPGASSASVLVCFIQRVVLCSISSN